jgi:two-component system, chemotaxis family, CheB/CheR fusion protein
VNDKIRQSLTKRSQSTLARVGSAAAPPKARLLLVEDCTDLAEATAELFRRMGLEVCITESGKEALETAPVFRPDIIVCDICLPDMSGLDAARAFRADRERRNAVLAICTAMAVVEIRSMEEELCPDHVDLIMSKPITTAQVQKLIAMSAEKTATLPTRT